MAKKIYNNNGQDIDPGRMRFLMHIMQEQTVDDGYGGTPVFYTNVLDTKAAKTKVGSGNQMALQAGATVFNQDCYFTIRYRRDFNIEKDQYIIVDGEGYTIAGFELVDVPVKWVKMLCIKSDWMYQVGVENIIINSMPASAVYPTVINTDPHGS